MLDSAPPFSASLRLVVSLHSRSDEFLPPRSVAVFTVIHRALLACSRFVGYRRLWSVGSSTVLDRSLKLMFFFFFFLRCCGCLSPGAPICHQLGAYFRFSAFPTESAGVGECTSSLSFSPLPPSRLALPGRALVASLPPCFSLVFRLSPIFSGGLMPVCPGPWWREGPLC
jgi:hypothetical protein